MSDELDEHRASDDGMPPAPVTKCAVCLGNVARDRCHSDGCRMCIYCAKWHDDPRHLACPIRIAQFHAFVQELKDAGKIPKDSTLILVV